MTDDIDAMKGDEVERVARAICRANRDFAGFEGTADYSMEDEVSNAWDLFEGEARAAIAAMSRNEHSSPEMAKLAGEVLGTEINFELWDAVLSAELVERHEIESLISMARAAKRLAGSVLTQAEDK